MKSMRSSIWKSGMYKSHLPKVVKVSEGPCQSHELEEWRAKLSADSFVESVMLCMHACFDL
jgi:hypothetical protein